MTYDYVELRETVAAVLSGTTTQMTAADLEALIEDAEDRVVWLESYIRDETTFIADPTGNLEDGTNAQEEIRLYEMELAKFQTALPRLTELHDQKAEAEAAADLAAAVKKAAARYNHTVKSVTAFAPMLEQLATAWAEYAEAQNDVDESYEALRSFNLDRYGFSHVTEPAIESVDHVGIDRKFAAQIATTARAMKIAVASRAERDAAAKRHRDDEPNRKRAEREKREREKAEYDALVARQSQERERAATPPAEPLRGLALINARKREQVQKLREQRMKEQTA